MPKWCNSKVVEKHNWTDGLFTLRIEAHDVLPFEPGQFLHLALKNGEEIINRPYSVASPHGKTIDFFIVKVSDGQLTPMLDQLRVGDEIMVSERAAGSFTLKKTPDANCLWLFGTGTGLAPFISMLRNKEVWNRYKKIVLAHGTRHLIDLGYQPELTKMAEENSGSFVYLPAVTRDESATILKGRLTNLLADGSLEKAAGSQISPEDSAVMLCGNPDMLDEMEKNLMDRGLKRHKSKDPGHIVVERYW